MNCWTGGAWSANSFTIRRASEMARPGRTQPLASAAASGYARHRETRVDVHAAAPELFDHLDDPRRLASHMSKSSLAMAGGSMSFTFDAGGGRAVGSRMRLAGRMLGIQLFVEESVTERRPPHAKAWETRGEPSLLVIGRYRMGFVIEPRGAVSLLRVYIDYDLPKGGWRWAAYLLGDAYAGWCTRRMAHDAKRSIEQQLTG